MAGTAQHFRAPGYRRHRPEQTLLYQLIQAHYPTFADLMAARGRALPRYVQREFEDYLKCGRLEHGFLRVRCDDCHHERLVAFSCKRRGFCPSCGARRMAESAALLVDDVLPRVPMRQWVLTVPFPLRFLFAAQPALMGQVLGIVYRAFATHLIRRAGHTRATARTGAVTLIQRFGGALNLNIHFHMLCLDGVYVTGPAPRFRRLAAPRHDELLHLLHTMSQRIARCLEKQGLLVRDMDNSYLDLEPGNASPLDTILGHAITYRIAVGPNAGRKVFTLQTVPAMETPTRRQLAQLDGFSLHAGVATQAHQRHKLERLCRYISRPALAEQRLSLTGGGNIRYHLKTPYRDGTTHVAASRIPALARH